jgi:hypothetical protein
LITEKEPNFAVNAGRNFLRYALIATLKTHPKIPFVMNAVRNWSKQQNQRRQRQNLRGRENM